MPSLEHRTSLVDRLLAEQQQFDTAASKFADWHDEQGHDEPLQARYYRNLIPLSKPLKGEQYAFEVNLDQCTGCKACVAACHSMNGLDDHESWRDMGALAGCRDEPYVQTVTTACHHCLDPACANGCPVLAYEKDAVTGIVRHLDDQCIGCSYCVLKCPYDVPKYNPKRGIVRKCDMCQQRLAVGEAPACVQSCPTGAIAIRIVKVEEVRQTSLIPSSRLLPGAFESGYTQPTTSYLSRRFVPDSAASQSRSELHLEEAHWPLAWMLVLTQFAAGLFLAAAASPATMLAPALMGEILLAAGLAASILHLGQPLRAWRAFLGWRKSWLSREIIAFGGFFKLGAVACWFQHPALTLLTAMAGLGSVFCSAMVYVDTRRPFWAASRTFLQFFGTTLLLGSAGAAAALAFAHPGPAYAKLAGAFALLAMVIRTALFVFATAGHRITLRTASHPNHRSSLALEAHCGKILRWRPALFWATNGFGVLGICQAAGLTPWWLALSLSFTFASQVLERHLFFVGATAPRMPGVPPSPHHPHP